MLKKTWNMKKMNHECAFTTNFNPRNRTLNSRNYFTDSIFQKWPPR